MTRYGGGCNCGDHVWAKLTRGYVTLVSPEDANLIEDMDWHAGHCRPRSMYAVRRGRSCTEALHRKIASAGEVDVVDHINRNGLDNRRPNLRLCKTAENIRNASPPKRRTGSPTRFKGVSREDRAWVARIFVDQKRIRLGRYKTDVEAAIIYDKAARKYFGEFALTNADLGLLS